MSQFGWMESDPPIYPVRKSALIVGDYRYKLTREWGAGHGRVNFIMLNPSTADGLQDDATIRRCVAYSKGWGYSGLVVTNLFALRSRCPKALKVHSDPVGRDNDSWILETAADSELIVCGWGAHGGLGGRDRSVVSLLKGHGLSLTSLTVTKDGYPGHPLFLSSLLEPKIYTGEPVA